MAEDFLDTVNPVTTRSTSLPLFSMKYADHLCPNSMLRLCVVEPPTGIFGVPLRQSITYANVAISLVDAEGKSYIYGYVPIVVAKCGVYLKEKGWCISHHVQDTSADWPFSDQC